MVNKFIRNEDLNLFLNNKNASLWHILLEVLFIVCIILLKRDCKTAAMFPDKRHEMM